MSTTSERRQPGPLAALSSGILAPEKLAGIAYGIATHLLFAVTVWHLFWFLYGGAMPSTTQGLWLNVVCALMFAVPHSLLLHPAIRGRLTHWISPAFYGLFFCNVTSITLLALIAVWPTSPQVVVCFTGLSRGLIRTGFYGSWVLMFYSLYLSGLGWQTGLAPWWSWVCSRPLPRREFQPRSLYRILRHPVYLGFLGLIWFNPTLTLDRLVLLVVWTTYIFVGSRLKDQRLVYFLGDRYREYQARVPGYPFLPVGPLARVPWKPGENTAPVPR